MGFRDYLKGKARSVIGRPQGGGVRSGTSRREALATLPIQRDAQGHKAVATSSVLVEGRGTTVAIDGHNVALFRVRGDVYAVDDACRHEDGPLGEGQLVGTVVTCPYHDWRYDVSTGECLTESSRPVHCYSVHEKDGFIWVGKRTRTGSDARGGEHNDGLTTVLLDDT